MSKISRRGFVQTAATVAATTSMVTRTTTAGEANDRLRVAVIGVNGRGSDAHFPGFQRTNENVEIVCLCDVDKAILNKHAKNFEKKYGVKPSLETDMRKVFERKDIDVVSVATPNHWHSLATIWACQAGKDVYVEKPGSHNVFEGRKMIEARDKYKRIVQHGVQLRSSEALRSVVDQMNKGVIGKVYMSRAIIYRWRPSVGKQASQPNPPSHLNWDMWVGPAQMTQFSRKYHPYNWHWHWAFGNGDLGNQGVHELDMSLWGLGEQMPSEVTAMGGKFLWDDDKETPEVMTANYLFPSGKMLEVEVRHWCSNYEDEISVGNIFYGSTGVVLVDGYNRYKIIKGGVNDIRQAGEWVEKGGDHFGNFIQAVRSRKNEDLHGPIETAHYSSAIAHLGNASYRLGRRLKFDVKTEQFVNDAEADQLITREYRAPFVVPKEV
jgi:predicted dehydrogenase